MIKARIRGCKAALPVSLIVLLISPLPAISADRDVGKASLFTGGKWLEPLRSQLKADPAAMPFYPSRMTTGGRTLTPDMFDRAEVCGGCHKEIFEQWQSSMMAMAWEDPIYRALLERTSEATGGATDNFCIGCHTPIGMATGMAQVDLETEEDPPQPGVDCETCHNITELHGTDNAAFTLMPPIDGRPRKLGPHDNAISPYHDSEYSSELTSSAFCATCHNVTHPFNGAAIERTYDEWLDSQYSAEGTRCQDCHMTPEPGVTRSPGRSAPMGEERSHVASHFFTGANVTLHNYFGQHEMAERAREMLRSAATMEVVDVPTTVRPGESATVTLKVSNVGAGHKLPTGFPEGREIWVDFRVHDGNGTQVFRSGAVEDGYTERGTQRFKVWLGDAEGNVVDINVWEVDHVIRDNRILPRGYDLVSYTFAVPEHLKGPLQIEADLNYWSFPQALVDDLVGEGVIDVEIVRMTTARHTLELDESGLDDGGEPWQWIKRLLPLAGAR